MSKREDLAALMQRLGVREEDLEERFVRSGGPGGQRRNKVSTCVILRHRPSGLEVRSQQERSQAQNRFFARRLLLARLEKQRLDAQRQAIHRLAKIRRQKRRRSRSAKERMLRDKRHQAQKKELRRLPRSMD